MIVVKDMIPGIYDDMGKFFNNLPGDQYATPGYRYRRFSRFKYGMTGHLETIEPDHFMQKSDINKAFGDIERKFEPLERELINKREFNQMVGLFQAACGGTVTTIDVHQVRIVVNPDKPAPAAPEGKHHDGYDFIGAFIVTRNNIQGGNFMLWDSVDTPDEDYLFKNDLIGKYAVIDDKKYVHTGDDLTVVDPSRNGVWEWFVIGGHKHVRT